MKTLLAATLTLLIFILVQPALAIDIVAPDNEIHSNGTEVTFEYYNTIENPTSCTLDIPPQSLPDITVQQGLNSFIVQNIDEGTYNWKISCENSTTTDESEPRQLIIDKQPPTIQLTEPSGAATELTVRALVTDGNSDELTCTYTQNGTVFDTRTLTEGEYEETTYQQTPGTWQLDIECGDKAGNKGNTTTTYEIEPNEFLTLETNKETYGLGETILLTIDAPVDATVNVDICPDEPGFVECVSPLIVPGFPQTVQLPVNNQSGDYLVEGIMNGFSGVLINSTRYTIENTIGLNLETNREPRLQESFELVAEVFGAIGAVTYTWEPHNGSSYETTTERFTVVPRTPGQKTDTLTIEDAAGNKKVTSVTYTVEESVLVTINVRDANGPIAGADVQETDGDGLLQTDPNGRVQLRLDLGTNKLYAAKDGYETLITDVLIDEETNAVTLTLEEATAPFTVRIDEPSPDQQFAINTTIPVKFTTRGMTDGSCEFFMAQDTQSFLEAKGNLNITSDGQTGFGLSELSAGRYAYSVECRQGTTQITTPKQYFTVASTQTTPAATTPTTPRSQYVADPNSEQDLFENALANIRSLGAKEQEIIRLLEIDKQVNKARKQSGQLNRDIFDMQYRTELTEEEKQAERQRLRTQLDQFLDETPVDVTVLDQQTKVAYITEEEIETFIEEYGSELNVPSGAAEFLADAQQAYTMKTTLYRARFTYADGDEEVIAAVNKEFTYGKEGAETGGSEVFFLEFIPSTVVSSAEDIIVINDEFQVLLEETVLQFPAGQQITYYIQDNLALSELGDVRTLLVPNIEMNENAITGFSILGESQLRGVAKNVGMSFTTLIAILIAAYLAYYFSLIDKVKYLFYQGGPKTKLHYMRVLLNDVHDNLAANNYDKALLIYKEIKLTYDKLELPAKNELFEEITMVCAELDKSFMKQLVLEMDKALKNDQLENAINYYARIEATYERLPPAEQQQVRDLVAGLAKRLGVTA